MCSLYELTVTYYCESVQLSLQTKSTDWSYKKLLSSLFIVKNCFLKKHGNYIIRLIKRYPKSHGENPLDRSRSKCFILSVDDIVMSARRRGASQSEGAEILLMPLCQADGRRLRTFRDPLMFKMQYIYHSVYKTGNVY